MPFDYQRKNINKKYSYRSLVSGKSDAQLRVEDIF